MTYIDQEAVDAAIAYAHDVGFDEGYEAAREEEHMTYAMCDNDACYHHDGDGCTLEMVSLKTEDEGMMACLDYEASCDQSGEEGE